MDLNFHMELKAVPGKPKVRIVYIKGEIDESSIDEFKKQIEEILSIQEASVFIFFLRDLEFINSTVIGYLANIFSRLRNEDRKMLLAEGNDKILDILELVGFLNLTEYHDTLEQAINSLEF